jgi:hypothetical protein
MTTQAPLRDSRSIAQRINDYRRDLAELRAAMDARSKLDPDSSEFREALAHEDELLDRIHRWSLGEQPK